VSSSRWPSTRALLALAPLLACRLPPMDPVGISDKRAGTAPDLDAAATPPSPASPDFGQPMTKVIARQLSRGHGLHFDGIVWINDAARPGWDAGGELADGSVLVEEAIDTSFKGDRSAGLLRMEKQGGAWRFSAFGADGGAAEEARCAACHAQAARDDVFRVDQSSSAASSAPTRATVPTAVASTAATNEARSAGPADASVSP
jgi:hypothetical protein